MWRILLKVAAFEINQKFKGHFLSKLRVSFNIFLPTHHFTELHNLLASTDVKYDVTGITESKLNHHTSHVKNITQLLISQM